jgi:hypothetical protein
VYAAAAVVLALLAVAPAAARAGTVHLSVTAVPPAKCFCTDYGSYEVTASGTYDRFPSQIDVYVHYGTSACLLNDEAENIWVQEQQGQNNNEAGEPVSAELGTDAMPSGTYSERFDWGVGAPKGSYQVCAYLLVPNGYSSQPSDPPEAMASAALTLPVQTGGGSTPGNPACVVPRLLGKTLAAATKALHAAGCSLGKVRKVRAGRAHRNRVVSQSPAPGTRRRHGAKVNVVVGR